MVFNIKFFTLIFCVLILSACDPDPQATALKERWQNHDWSNNQPELMLDINNDGEQERALLGVSDKTIIISVFLQDDVTKMDFIELFVDKANQKNSICGTQATLTVESQKYPIRQKVSPTPRGYQYCPECQGLRVTDKKDCDPFHIYWDHSNQRLSWWRN